MVEGKVRGRVKEQCKQVFLGWIFLLVSSFGEIWGWLLGW
jgi:hypothetical protein